MAPFSVSFPALLSRSYLNTRRQPLLVIARIMQVVALGMIQALFFARLSDGQSGVQNRIGVIQQTFSVIFVGLLNCVAVFPNERDTLFNEYGDRAYGVESFFMAYNLIEFPIEVLSAIAFTVFTMIVVGLRTTWVTFFCMVLGVFCMVNVGESIGIAFCSLVRHVGFSVSLTNSVLGIFSVMSGLLSSNTPLFLDRFNRISAVPYFARLWIINEFDSQSTFSCTNEELVSFSCFYRNGDDVLKLLTSSSDVFGYDRNLFTMYICVGTGLTVMYRIIAFLFLKFKASH